MNTKDRIAQEALYLFSEKGYTATSVRDIADAVGIKDSSLYNHYKSKQEIFDYVIKKYEKSFQEKFFSFYKKDEVSADSIILFNDSEMVSKLGRQLFISFVSDDDNNRLRKLLVTEMHHNNEIKKIYASYLKEPIVWTTILFKKMMSTGILVKTDAQPLAYEFMAPIYTLLTEYDCGEITMEAALDLLERHVTTFFQLSKMNERQNR